MSRRIGFYKWKRGANLSSWEEVWGPILGDLDLRLAAREDDATYVQSVVSSLEMLALSRLNDTFTPLILEAQERLNSLGASFAAESLTEITMPSGGGQITLDLTAESSENYVPTDYVSVRAAVDQSKSMIGRLVSFERLSGGSATITLDVEDVQGSGTYSDWYLRITAAPDLTHAERTDNPHKVTAAQLGNPAGSNPAYTRTETDDAIDAAVTAAIAALPPISTALLKADNLSDLTNIAAARTALGLGALAVLGSVGWGEISANIHGTGTDFRTNASYKHLTPNAVWDAAAYVAIAEGNPVSWNMSNGFNFYLNLSATRTLAFPSNPKVGQSGMIEVNQPPSGNCTLGYAGGFSFDSNIAPGIALGGSQRSALIYHCRSVSEVRIGLFGKGF